MKLFLFISAYFISFVSCFSSDIRGHFQGGGNILVLGDGFDTSDFLIQDSLGEANSDAQVFDLRLGLEIFPSGTDGIFSQGIGFQLGIRNIDLFTSRNADDSSYPVKINEGNSSSDQTFILLRDLVVDYKSSEVFFGVDYLANMRLIGDGLRLIGKGGTALSYLSSEDKNGYTELKNEDLVFAEYEPGSEDYLSANKRLATIDNKENSFLLLLNFQIELRSDLFIPFIRETGIDFFVGTDYRYSLMNRFEEIDYSPSLLGYYIGLGYTI